MITNIILYIFSFLIGALGHIAVFISQGWSIWPPQVLDGLTYFFQHLMTFNIVLPIREWLIALKFFLGFDAIYISVKLLMKIFNWVRGSGGIEV